MKSLTASQLRLAAWAGLVGPALFVAVFTLEGWLRPGYEPLSTYVSALSLGPRGWIQIANFIVFGLLLLVFTRAVAAEFRDGKASRGGLILLTIIPTVATKLPGNQTVFSDWLGLIQRTAMVPFMIWLFIFALGLLRRVKQS